MEDTYKRFKVSQQIVLRDADGKVLMLHSTEYGNWLLPGGRIDESETDIEESLRREVREELGIEITIGEPIGVDTNRNGTAYAIAFLAETSDISLIRLSDEHDELKWVPPSELPEYLYYKNLASAIAQRLA